MKKNLTLAGALLLLCTLAFAGTGFAADVTYKTYTDKKFGYSIEYPDIYNAVNGPFVTKAGISDFSAYSSTAEGDGKYAFMLTGKKRPKGADGNSLLKDATNMEEDKYGYVYGVEALPGTAKSGANFYTLEYLDDSFGVDAGGAPASITRIYGVVGKNVLVEYRLRFPKGEAERFAPIAKRMDASLKVK